MKDRLHKNCHRTIDDYMGDGLSGEFVSAEQLKQSDYASSDGTLRVPYYIQRRNSFGMEKTLDARFSVASLCSVEHGTIFPRRIGSNGSSILFPYSVRNAKICVPTIRITGPAVLF